MWEEIHDIQQLLQMLQSAPHSSELEQMLVNIENKTILVEVEYGGMYLTSPQCPISSLYHFQGENLISFGPDVKEPER
eukprot:m.16444 g.16444  ORF g.16444 m.16444 type:complete len:78 (-) comp5703_c0_seq1:92-325(-)